MPLQSPADAKRRAAVIAVALSLAWLFILLAGADHPPPLGFLWLLPILLVGAVLVYWRAVAYAMWNAQAGAWRIGRVIAEGAVGGLIVATVLQAIPSSGQTGVRVSGPDTLIWLAVLAAIGSINAAVVYFLTLRRPAGDDGA